jgi:SNF2 family DNA or RNA helicase
MRELAEVLEELGNKQVIIWINFRFEVDAITDMLREQGKTFATLYSGTEDRDDSIKGFQEGRYQILVANSHSAAHGLTFVNCSNAIYFSLDYSYESWEQSRNRLHRIGQVNKCLYITLIAENSIDQMVLQVLQRKKTLQDIIYELTQQEAKEPLTGDIEL